MSGERDSRWREWWRERGERELQCILMTAWDPIGVGDVPQAWDEYREYTPEIGRILRETEDPEAAASQVTEYLTGIERNAMAIGTDESRLANAHLAASLVAWHQWSYLQDGAPPHHG